MVATRAPQRRPRRPDRNHRGVAEAIDAATRGCERVKAIPRGGQRQTSSVRATRRAKRHAGESRRTLGYNVSRTDLAVES